VRLVSQNHKMKTEVSGDGKSAKMTLDDGIQMSQTRDFVLYVKD
jgi:hypothetical protein